MGEPAREPAKRTASIAQADGWPSIVTFIFVRPFVDRRGRRRRLVGRIVPAGKVPRYPWRVEGFDAGAWSSLEPSRDSVPPDEALNALLDEMRRAARLMGVSTNNPDKVQSSRHRKPVAYSRDGAPVSVQQIRDRWRGRRPVCPQRVDGRAWGIFLSCLLGISRRSIAAAEGIRVVDVVEAIRRVDEALRANESGRGT